jgi:hypothetical protein
MAECVGPVHARSQLAQICSVVAVVKGFCAFAGYHHIRTKRGSSVLQCGRFTVLEMV